jgi:deoxyribonuclease-4
MLIGAHVPGSRPLEEAAARGAGLVQIFLSNPQSWQKPTPRQDAAELAASGLPIYVHAPYLINVASPDNRVRIPSRKILSDTLEAAAAIGAAGVVVHGGHTGPEEGIEVGAARWRKALDAVGDTVPVLLENTAGGGNALLRDVANFGPLWEAIADMGVGVCLDTCHAWSAGEDLGTIVGRVLAMTGRVDLVHCNDSRDPRGSGRDRHARLGMGTIPVEAMVGVVRAASAPVVVETPGEAADHAAEFAWLRDRLG